jgi:transposase-like protein
MIQFSVHLIRHSLEFVSWKDRKHVVQALRRSTEPRTQKLA